MTRRETIRKLRDEQARLKEEVAELKRRWIIERGLRVLAERQKPTAYGAVTEP